MTDTAPALPRQRAVMLLQAAVAEAALGEGDLAHTRVNAMLRTGPDELFAAATVAADFLDRLTLVHGNEWALGPPPVPGIVPRDLDRRVPRSRVLTLRLMAAWSAGDADGFTALYRAATGTAEGSADLGDLFAYVLDWVDRKARSVGNPRVLLTLLCAAVSAHRHRTTDFPGHVVRS